MEITEYVVRVISLLDTGAKTAQLLHLEVMRDFVIVNETYGGRKHMTDNSKKNTKGKEIYIYDTEGHYTWHSSFREAFENIQESITRKE